MTDPLGSSHDEPWVRSWHHRVPRRLGRVELTSLRVTVVYVVFGFFALFVSDVLFVRFLSDPFLREVQALKGAVEVVLTGGFIYVLTRRSRAQVREANEEVERQRDELRLLHRVFRHNFRNDVNVIQGYAELARDEVDGGNAGTRLERIVDRTERMSKYAEKARRVRRVTERSDQLRTYDLSTTIARVLDEHTLVTDAVDVTTEIPDGARVRANPMFEEALHELVGNAIQHSDAGTTTIAIAADGGGAFTEIRIRDNGPGIPPTEIESLSEGVETQLLHSSGMGLWFVDWVVTHSDGELTLTATEGGGTEILIRLPTAADSG